MNERPEYIKCVADTHLENKGYSWCKRKIEAGEWTFVDAEHAAMNGRNGGRLQACVNCVSEIHKGLTA